MAFRKIEVTEYTCDACGKMQLIDDEIELIGLSGTVFEQHGLGGSGTVKWFACTRKCVGKAVINAVDRENEK